jgi:uncharacterized protein (DUF1499 family)
MATRVALPVASSAPPRPVRRRDALRLAVGGVATSLAARTARADEEPADVLIPPPPPASQPSIPRRPRACIAGSSCVSTASFRNPANYLPPWEYVQSDEDAFAALESVLNARPGTTVTTSAYDDGFVAATLRYEDGLDDVAFWFTRATEPGSKSVLFIAQSRENKASPPGCFKPGCVNGPRNRARMEELMRAVGWLPLEVRSIHWSPYDRVGVVNADP